MNIETIRQKVAEHKYITKDEAAFLLQEIDNLATLLSPAEDDPWGSAEKCRQLRCWNVDHMQSVQQWDTREGKRWMRLRCGLCGQEHWEQEAPDAIWIG